MALLTDADVFGPAPGAGGGLLTDEDVFGPSPATEIDAGATVTNIPARSSPREVSWGDVVSGVADTMGPMTRRQVAGLMQYGANGEMTAGERADVMGSRYFGEAKGETEQETQAEIEARRAEVRQSSARIAEEAARDMAAARPDVDPNSVKGFAYDFAVSMANMAPAVAATIATRQPAIGMSMIGGQVFGDQYAESREKGRTHDQAIQDGVFMAAAEAIPEAIPLGILARPGASMVSRFFKGTVAEGVQEMFTQALQDGYSAGILDEDMTWGQAMENLARAGLLGSAMGGSFAVVTEPFVRAGRDAPVGPGDAPPVPPATGREDEPERDEGGTSSVVAGSRVRISDPGGPLDGQEATVTNPGTPDSPGVEVDVGGETRTIGKSLLRPVKPKRMAPVTPEDVASPIATDKISRGKAMLDDAAAGRPLDIERPAEGTSAAPEGVSPEPEALTRSAEPLSSVRQEPDAVDTADAVAPPGPEWRPIYSDTTRGEQVGWVNPQTGEEVALDTAPEQQPAAPAQATPAPAPAVPVRQQQDVPVTGNPLTDQDVGLVPQQAPTAQDNRATAAPPSAERVAQAAAETDTAPTEGQKEAGNYRKGKVRYAGHEISIENPRGSQRSGTDPNGEAWSVTMPADYGYIRRSTGADGDQVDVYLGQGPETGPVFVVDQVDADTGRFDEHKAFMGFPTRAEAEAAYRAAFSDGRGDARMGAVTEMSQDQFKAWLRDGDQTKPAGQIEARSRARTLISPAATPAEARPLADTIDARMTAAADVVPFLRGERERVAGEAETPGGKPLTGKRRQAFIDGFNYQSAVIGRFKATEPSGLSSQMRRYFDQGADAAAELAARYLDRANQRTDPREPATLREEGPPESTTPDPDGYIDQWQDLAARLDGVTGLDARVAVADAWVREEGARTGHEHVAIFDGDGRLIQAGTQGKDRAVNFSGATRDRLADPAADMVATHNHPAATAPSNPDISQLAHDGLAEVRVVAGDVVYSVSLPDTIKEQAGDPVQFRKFLDRVNKVARDRMQKAINSGVISAPRANEVYQHLVNVLLHRLGVTNYVTTLPKEQITPAEMAVIDKAMPMARAIAGNFSNRTEQSEADVYRSTVPVRSGEGLAEVRGRGEDARPVDPRSEMGARADRRAEEAAGRTAQGGLTPRRQGARFRLQDAGDRTMGEALTENVTGSLFSRGPGGTNRGDDRTSFSKDGTTYTWDPELLEQADDLVRYLRRQVRQMNPNAKVLVVDKVIQDSTGRTAVGVSAEDIPDIGRAIVVAMRYVDENGKVRPNPSPGDTLNHEVMHDLRRQGLFTAEEESVLFGNSDRNRLWRRRFEVDRLYDGEPDAVRREEAAAMAWEAWKAGRLRVAGRIRRAFQKVDRFLRALANWVSGKGFTATEPPFLDREAEQVFERIDAGEVGRREPAAGAPGDGSRFSVVADAGRQTDTAAFKRWFGDSKVVDENGEPLRVFHGTNADVEAFDAAAGGRNTGAADGAQGFFFSSDPATAASYTEFHDPYVEMLGDNWLSRAYARVSEEFLRISRIGTAYASGGNVVPVYLSIQNPFVVDVRGARYDPQEFLDSIMAAKEAGHDGVVFQQARDSYEGRAAPADVYVPFRPTQIKSATGNRGTFDPADPNILREEVVKFDARAAERKVARSITPADRALIDKHLAPAGGGLISRLARASFIRDIARDGFADTLVTNIVTSLNPIFAYEKRAEAMTGGIPKVRDASVSAAKMAEFTMNDTGRTWAMFHAGPMRYDAEQGIVVADETVPGLYDIFKYLSDPATYDRFRLYAAARRAERLAAEGRENNMTDAAIARGLDLADETGRHKGETRTFRQVFDDYQRFNKALLEGMGRDTGMMSQEDIDFYTEHMDYVPFYREAEETGTVPTGAFLRKNINKPDAGIKKLEGGEQRIADLMENIVRNAEAITRAGMRNVTMRRIYEIAEVLGEGQIVRDGAAEDGVLTYRVNGREVKFTVDDPSLVAAVASMRPEQHTGLYKALVSITGFFRAGITAMPSFMLRNLVRGTTAGFVQTGKNISLQHNVATGLKRAWRNDRSIRELKAITGTGSYTFGGPSGNAAGLLRRSTGAQRDFMPISVVKSVWGALERAGEATELADRDAIYNNLIREGATKAEAAYQAMNLINYSRKGSSRSLRVLLPLVPFLNARIQGLYRMGETQTGGVDRRKILAGVAVRGLVLTAVSVALREWTKDDDRYDDEPLHRKLNYYILYVGDTRILIPKAFEFGALFSTLPELLLDAIEQKEGKRLAEGLAQTLLTTFAFNPIPQPALPMIENIANYNFFTGREIENQRLKNLPAGQRYTAATPQVLREIGKATDLSPAQMENLIRGYTGSMGMSLLAGLDSIGRAAGAFPSEPTGPFGDYGIFSDALQDQLGSMYREGPDRSNRWIGDLYELSRDINQTYRHVESLVEEGEMEAARKAAEDGRIEWRTFVNRQVKALSTINAQIRMVDEDLSLTGAYKRTELNKLYEIRNRIAEMAVKQATGRE